MTALEAVRGRIAHLEPALSRYPDLWRVFSHCFLNTLETTVEQTKGDTFVITGDIHAMWLRDSTAQVMHYLRFADDEAVAELIEGLLARQAKNILIDPYANAYNRAQNSRAQRDVILDQRAQRLRQIAVRHIGAQAPAHGLNGHGQNLPALRGLGRLGISQNPLAASVQNEDRRLLGGPRRVQRSQNLRLRDKDRNDADAAKDVALGAHLGKAGEHRRALRGIERPAHVAIPEGGCCAIINSGGELLLSAQIVDGKQELMLLGIDQRGIQKQPRRIVIRQYELVAQRLIAPLLLGNARGLRLRQDAANVSVPRKVLGQRLGLGKLVFQISRQADQRAAGHARDLLDGDLRGIVIGKVSKGRDRKAHDRSHQGKGLFPDGEIPPSFSDFLHA